MVFLFMFMLVGCFVLSLCVVYILYRLIRYLYVLHKAKTFVLRHSLSSIYSKYKLNNVDDKVLKELEKMIKEI